MCRKAGLNLSLFWKIVALCPVFSHVILGEWVGCRTTLSLSPQYLCYAVFMSIYSVKLLVYWNTEQSSWLGNSPSRGQEIQVVWNPKVCYCVCRNLQLVCVLNQINPVHTLLNYCFKIHYNINTPGYFKVVNILQPFILIRCICLLSHSGLVPCPAFPRLDDPNSVWWWTL